VTDQGSVTPTHNGLLASVKNKAIEIDINHISMRQRCCVCKNLASSWLRNGFLRYYSTKPSINLPYSRPP
jgi:hypothetical protein